MEIGDPVHFWGRKFGMSPVCYRGWFLGTDGEFARVKLAGQLAGPMIGVRTATLKQVKPGWNNWVDQEGRPILPEHFLQG